MKKNFKECKEIFETYSNEGITKEEFNAWSKENCENCFFYIVTGKRYCFFGNKK